MSNYTGALCPVCEKRFADGDDIVVCPNCGAPHHRTCYRQLGHCAHESLHAEGYSWKPAANTPPQAEASPQQNGSSQENAFSQEQIFCPSCGAKNPFSGLFCQSCGATLKSDAAGATQQQPHSQQQAQSQPYTWQSGHAAYKIPAEAYLALFGGLSPDDTIEGIPVREIALRIGPSSHYFLPRFKQISEQGGISINLSAFLFNFLYFFYRKMYLPGFILLGLFLIGISPAFFLFPEFFQFVVANMEEVMMGANLVFEPTQNLWALQLLPFARIFLLFCGILFSFLANRLYFRNVMHSIRKLKKNCINAENKLDESRYAHSLRLAGGCSLLGPILCIVSLFGGVYLISMMLTLFVMGI